MATRRELLAKSQIMKQMSKEGYPTYANLLDKFELHLTQDPAVVGYTEPNKGTITVNSGLDIEQVSMIIRHEILHNFLDHETRLLKKLASDRGLNFSELEDKNINELKNELYSDKTFNIAGDYEISNRGYTEADKKTARAIKLNGQRLKGLVTEDDHPDWVDLSIEDMYEKLRELQKQDKQDAQDQGNSGESGDDSSDNSQSSDSQSNDSQSGDAQSDSQSSSGDGDSQGSSSDSPLSDDEMSDLLDKAAARKKQPEIGERGNEDVQKAEQARREAQEAKEKAEESESASSDLKSQADQAAKDAEDILDDAKAGEDVEDRLTQLKKMLSDVKTQENALREIDANISAERGAAAARDAARFKQSPINRFTDNLNKFIARETAHGREASWKRFSKKYQDTGIIRPGSSRLANKNVPSINVYFDRSGSWDADKTRVGSEAIATLNKYVKRGEIKINLFYFNTRVFSNYTDHGSGGTSGQPILDHIQQTKPDNVIVMTDSDISDCRTDVQVPGAVWFLFKDGVSENLKSHLSGKKQTNSYEI